MSVAMPIDSQYERLVVESVTKSGEWYTVHFKDGMAIGVIDAGIEPEPGDAMRLYGRGFGYPVRGIAIEGKGTVRYETEEEARASHALRVEEDNAERRKEFEAKKADHDLRIRELPLPFRERIERFQVARPDWRWEHEGYELFVCEEAVRIARHFEGENAIWRLNEWAERPYAEQQAEVAVSDQHSGNTFGCAISLARTFLLGNMADVIHHHGAMCPLLGCEEYGCYAARAARSSQPGGSAQ